MNLAQTRQHIAAELTSRLVLVSVYPRRPNVVRVGDGWLVLRSVAPATFATSEATFDIVIILSADDQEAETAMDAMAVDLVDAVTALGGSTGVTPLSLSLDGGELFAVAANLNIEVGE